MVYVRTNQRMKRPNFFSRQFIKLSAQFNRLVLREDERVVVTQRPKIAGLDIDWSMAEDGDIAPSLPYGLLPKRSARQPKQQAEIAI